MRLAALRFARPVAVWKLLQARPPSQRPPALPLQGLCERLHHHQRHPVCRPQGPAAFLSGRYCRVQRTKGQRQERAGALPRSEYVTQSLLGSTAQGPRSDGRGVQGPQAGRGWQGRGSGWRRHRYRGYVKPIWPNIAGTVASWRIRTGKRQSVIMVRERNGGNVPAVFRSEGAALAWIKSRVNAWDRCKCG